MNRKIEKFEGKPIVWKEIETTGLYLVKFLPAEGEKQFVKRNTSNEEGVTISNSTLFFNALRDDVDHVEYLDNSTNASMMTGQTLKLGLAKVSENDKVYGGIQDVLDLFEIKKIES
tara:strand:+ start:911 stop:1258 length:348 start_codon:yes stop_codon:yes gene_type:complete